jgi:hypothetical protein
MEDAELDRIRQQFDQLVRERMPGAPVERVEVLQYGDDPEIEPGQLLARVVVTAPDEEPGRLRSLEAFHHEHRLAFHDLRQELDKLPVSVILQFTASGGQPAAGDCGPQIKLMHAVNTRGVPGPEGPGLTPVMARLGPEDLETLDTLIAAGIATSRAEAVRWALARIRERPAFEQLRARTREIEELKSQF